MWAACCMAFFRIGKITVDSQAAHGRDTSHWVAVGDVAVDDRNSPSVLKIRLQHSKTDQYSQSVDVYLGHTGDELCPVSAVLAFLAVRGSAPGPLFRWSDGRFLTKAAFTSTLREALSTLGYDASEYAGHSFRIGVATMAAERGIEVKMLGRWDSSAYQLHVRASRQMLSSIARKLVITDAPGGQANAVYCIWGFYRYRAVSQP